MAYRVVLIFTESSLPHDSVFDVATLKFFAHRRLVIGVGVYTMRTRLSNGLASSLENQLVLFFMHQDERILRLSVPKVSVILLISFDCQSFGFV